MPSTAFGQMLTKAIKDKGLTASDFAAIIGRSHSWISQVKTGKRTPPLDQLPLWARKLGIEQGSEEYRRFRMLAAIAHLPVEVQPEFELLVDELALVKQELQNILQERGSH